MDDLRKAFQLLYNGYAGSDHPVRLQLLLDPMMQMCVADFEWIEEHEDEWPSAEGVEGHCRIGEVRALLKEIEDETRGNGLHLELLEINWP